VSVIRLSGLARRGRRDERGATVVEFAIAAPILITLLLGIYDMGHWAYLTAVLRGAVNQTARNDTLETADTSKADAYVADIVKGVAPGATVVSKRVSYYDFADIKRAESWNDKNGNGICDNAEAYTDENKNGQWDRQRRRQRRHALYGDGDLHAGVLHTLRHRQEYRADHQRQRGQEEPALRTSGEVRLGGGDLPVIRTNFRPAAFARRLRDDTRAVSFMEFALILPILITLGFYGAELAYMATVNMQIGQIASSVADNASRLGQTDNSAVTPTVSETQVDSVMTGALVEGGGINFESSGRIILSSLEVDSATSRQYIHWQRCRGNLKVKSKYGATGAGLTGTKLSGMGDPAITANANSAVMFVEVYYAYQPLFGTMFVDAPTFHRESAFIIRDDRNLEKGVTGGNGKSLCT
jgi:Flp pilus assembly protein TadG